MTKINNEAFFKEALRNAESGKAKQMITVALCYAHAMGTILDINKCKYWLDKAEQTDDLESLLDLGELYEQGTLLNIDLQKAKSIYEKLRSKNMLAGSYKLGKFYLKHNFEKDDTRKAAEYFNDAAKYGHVLSKIYLNKISRGGGLGAWRVITGYLSYPVIIIYGVISIFSNDVKTRYWYYEDMFPGGKVAQALQKRTDA